MIKTLFLVGIGGLLGSMFRYVVSFYLTKNIPSTFPYGTFVVNIIGCLFIGLIYGFSERYNWLAPEWRVFLTTGFCGGFTTFSAFAYENIKLLQSGEYLSFSLYSICSFAFGLLAVFAGLSLTKI